MYSKEQLDALKYNELRRIITTLGISSGSNPTKDHLKELILKSNPKEVESNEVLTEASAVKPTDYIETVKSLRQQVKEQFVGIDKLVVSVTISENNSNIVVSGIIDESPKLSSVADNSEIMEEAKAIEEQLNLEDESDEEDEESESEIDEVANELLKKFR